MPHLDFPASPSVGQKYPSTPIGGIPTYNWDGEKWTTVGSGSGVKTPVYTDGSSAMAAQLTLIAPPVAATDAAAKSYVDSQSASAAAGAAAGKMQLTGNQTVTGGFGFTPYSQAPGSFTVNPMNGNYQYTTNNGAFTITAPTVDCAVDILITNGAAAGTVLFANFLVGSNVGDALTTVNTSRFIVSVRRINGVATYVIKALQ